MISPRWKRLLENIEVTEDDSGTEILSCASLLSIEAKEKIVLPEGYKELCQTLGTGLLAERVRIFCPTKKYIESERSRLSYAIKRIIEYAEIDLLRNTDRDQKIISLLESAFTFGDLYNAYYSLIWDLRTYDKSDDSYDICYINCDTPEVSEPILLGRDFLEFIESFCYGSKPYNLLPDMFENLLPHEIKTTFFQFKIDS
jgi:hypothetical protein